MHFPYISVVVHLYYPEMLNEFSHYLDNVQKEVDGDVNEIITINDESYLKLVTDFRPQADVRIVPNSGSDIGPFMSVLNTACEGDIILKIHTNKKKKKRDGLIRPLCGTPYDVRECLNIMQNPTVGMIGSNLYTRSFSFKQLKLNVLTDELKHMLDIQADCNGFVPGTNFWVDSTAMYPLIPYIPDIIAKMPMKYAKCGTYAHAMERIFGNLVQSQGMKIQVRT